MSLIERAAQRMREQRYVEAEPPVEPPADRRPPPSVTDFDFMVTQPPDIVPFEAAAQAEPVHASPPAPGPPSVPAWLEAMASPRQASPRQAVPPLRPGASRPAPAQSKRVVLNQKACQAAGIIVPNQRNRLSEEFRIIKRSLIANAMGRGAAPIDNGNLIMVTSAVPGEGKTFTSINLAISIAMELDNTVMLVDADVAKPSVLRTLGLPPAPGLLDVVSRNSVDISEVLIRTNIEKLSILPSGTSRNSATELLASDAMVRLLDDMGKRYQDRIIVFDSPPLLSTTESRALATHMGQIVMVVHAGETTQSLVNRAIDAIDACPVKMLLLNQAKASGIGGLDGLYG